MLSGVFLIALLYGGAHSKISLSSIHKFYPALQPLSLDMINYVNDILETTWIAGPTTRFKSVDEAKRLLLRIHDPDQDKLPERSNVGIDVNNLPDSFDSRVQWPNCTTITEIWDQGMCGSCWVFSSVEAMSDRLCIASKGEFNLRLSTEQVLSCCTTCGLGCHGGSVSQAWKYYITTGLVTGGPFGDQNCCQPYSLPPCEHHIPGPRLPCHYSRTPKCHQQCQASYNSSFCDDKHYGEVVYKVKGVPLIQQEIMTDGPVTAVFALYSDFLNYRSGVYQHVAGRFVGFHAIKIIGWGVENNIPYWLVANSWNEDWGDKGFFKILLGVNECHIESFIVTGMPKL